jgi:hypothetical protein
MKPIVLRRPVEVARWTVRVLVALALAALWFAWQEWAYPSRAPFEGRTAWVAEAAVGLLGERGLAYLWLAASVALLMHARFVWRHTPKRPSDHWLWTRRSKAQGRS